MVICQDKSGMHFQVTAGLMPISNSKQGEWLTLLAEFQNV